VCAIVGEPTLMQLAMPKRITGFRCKIKGTPSHAAHQNNDNAIYKTIPVMEWFKIIISKSIDQLGPVK
jgi:acetylornithine deacetylase